MVSDTSVCLPTGGGGGVVGVSPIADVLECDSAGVLTGARRLRAAVGVPPVTDVHPGELLFAILGVPSCILLAVPVSLMAGRTVCGPALRSGSYNRVPEPFEVTEVHKAASIPPPAQVFG